MSFRKKIHKLFYWEFWPVYMFYIPNIPYALYHAIVERSLTFYTLTNPGIDNSGIGTESKFETQQLIPEKYLPKTIFHKESDEVSKTIKQVEINNFNYPIIVKPDVGFRGLLVKKIRNQEELVTYLKRYPINFLIQEFIDYPNECGLFFIRHPQEEMGKITSITLKDCPKVTGDGSSTIKQLIENDKHLSLYANEIVNLTSVDLNFVPKKGENIQLSTIGNHAKGTKFINGNHLDSDQLTETINSLNKEVKGWFYGRLDIKYNTWEDVLKGDFKVIELNGILGEPTHIYDTSKMTYWKAIKTMRNHWRDLYTIAAYNHKTGLPYKKTGGFIKELKALKRYTKKVKSLV